jgi:hypothetical protein
MHILALLPFLALHAISDHDATRFVRGGAHGGVMIE